MRCCGSAVLPDRTIRYYGPNYGNSVHANLTLGNETGCGEQEIGDGGDQKVAVHVFDKAASVCLCGAATPEDAPPI